MADEATTVTAEEFAAWITPRVAVLRAGQALGDQASGAIWTRLKGGLIKAAASSSSRAKPPRAEPQLTSTPTIIPARYWGHFSDSTGLNFWRTGDARFFFGAANRGDSATVILCFGIRFRTADIDALYPPLQVKPQPEPSPVSESDIELADPEPKGPAVSADHLKTWFNLYQRVYTGSEDTEATALKSASGMFPGKHVSRDRIRDLRGAQKRGRRSDEK